MLFADPFRTLRRAQIFLEPRLLLAYLCAMSSPPNQRLELARKLGEVLRQRRWRLTCAESCTGGGIAEAITSVAGSSDYFEFGFVTYADRAKRQLLGVDSIQLQEQGAVSELVVMQMAEGALRVADADLAVAVSGIAGPDGGTPEKPVGTVWLAWSSKDGTTARRFCFEGDRSAVRQQAVLAALQGLLDVPG